MPAAKLCVRRPERRFNCPVFAENVRAAFRRLRATSQNLPTLHGPSPIRLWLMTCSLTVTDLRRPLFEKVKSMSVRAAVVGIATLFVIGLASTASADIMFSLKQGSLQPDEELLFNEPTTGNPVTGHTNN